MKKRRINEKMGGGSRIGLGGMNSDGPHNTRYHTKNPSGYHTGGFQGNADSIFSQRQALISTLNEFDEDYDDVNDLFRYDDSYDYNHDEYGDDQEDLNEFFARLIKMPLIETIEQDSLDEEEEEEDQVKEFSGVAALGGGPATPLGTNAKGKVTNKKQKFDFIQFAKNSVGMK